MSKAVFAGLLLCLLALAGCGGLVKVAELQVDLESAGYGTTTVHHDTMNGQDVLTIGLTTTGEWSDEDEDRVAELVWRNYPGEIDELWIMADGQFVVEVTGAELLDRYGERPADLFTAGRDRATPVFPIVVVVVVGLLLAGLVVLVWWRGRRPPPFVPPPANLPMPHPYQYRPPFQAGP